MSNEGLTVRDGEESSIEAFADWYAAAVPIHVAAAALGLLTHGATVVLDAGVTSGLQFLRRSRMRAFASELIVLNLQPTPAEMQSREFVEGFLAAASKAIETKREEKIRLFAVLFWRYWRDGSFTPESFDRYEEDLKVIDELGYREFMVLSILYRHETRTPREKFGNPLQHARKFWADFQEEVSAEAGIVPEELEGYLQGISRTGLYQPITGGFFDYAGGLGHLSPRFERLQQRLDPDQPTA